MRAAAICRLTESYSYTPQPGNSIRASVAARPSNGPLCSALKVNSMTATSRPKIMFFTKWRFPGNAVMKGRTNCSRTADFMHEAARNLNRHIVCVVGHDAVLVRSAPGGIVFDHKRFDINDGSQCSRGCHGYLIRCTRY